MLKKIIPVEYRKLYRLFSRPERFKIMIIFAMMLAASFLEVVGIGMIPVFISIVASPDMVLGYEPIGGLLSALGVETDRDLLVAGALLLIGIFVVKGIYMLFFHYIKTRFVFNRRYTISARLMSSYMRAPYTFHLGRNTSELLRNITSEVNILINHVLNPSMELAKEVIMVVSVLVFLIIVEPLITFVVFVVLGGATGLFLYITQQKVQEYGKKEQVYRGTMIKAVDEGLGGLKEARVLNREEDFIQTFRETAFWSSRLQATTNFIMHIPKPVIEAVAVVGMMLVAVIMVWQGRPMVSIIPIITLFGIATVRLMPAIQTMTSTLTTLGYGLASVNPIYDDLELMKHFSRSFNEDRKRGARIPLEWSIELKNISYSYPESSEQALSNISLTIPKGKAVAFVGSSGAGKTTIVDLLLGLLEPDEGEILVDGRNIKDGISAWQKNIGYIPQFIYLADNTLRRNIAFGLPENEIDDIKIVKAVELAQLSELVRSLPEGLDTIIGEDGTKLSGGQRQRVGIARALYHEPEVLVMDEATSALDNITEKQITEAIESLKGERTIIMIAHRLTTVENCDVLFMMKSGQITDMGRYDELVKNNREFRKMALVE